MGILHMLLANLGAARLTHRPAELPPPPPGFRGALKHAAASCTGCSACAYACSPGAITLTAGSDGRTFWNYDPGRCTFCARCAAICPTSALSLEALAPPLAGDAASGRLADAVPQRPCGGCGQLFTPLPAPTIARVYGDLVPAFIARNLCEECRRHAVSTAIKGEHR